MTTLSRYAILVLACVALASPTLLAQDCADRPYNIFATENCDVALNIDNWQTLNGNGMMSFEGGDGDPPGSLRLDSVSTVRGMLPSDSATVGMCSSLVSPSTAYTYEMSIRAVTGSISSCTVNLLTFASTDCTGVPAAAGVAVAFFGTTWQSFSGEAATGVDVGSGFLITQCFSTSPFTVHLDNAVLEAVMFADGFETGDVTAWS